MNEPPIILGLIVAKELSRRLLKLLCEASKTLFNTYDKSTLAFNKLNEMSNELGFPTLLFAI